MKLAFRIPLYVIGIIAVIILAGFYIYYFTTLPESELNNWIASLVGSEEDITISVRRVNRDVWDHLMLEGVMVMPRGEARVPSVYISKIELDYDIMAVLRNKHIYRSLVIDTVLVEFPASAVSEEVISSGGKGVRLPIDASIQRVFINTIEMTLPDSERVVIGRLALSASSYDDQLDINLDNVTARWPDRDIDLYSASGNFSYDQKGVTVNNLNVTTSRSSINLRGSVGHDIINDIELSYDCNPVSLQEIENLTGVKVEGNLRASGTIEGSLDDFSGIVMVNGLFFGREFEDLNLSYRYSDKAFTFGNIDGEIFRSRFRGSGRLDFSTRPESYSYSGEIEHLDLVNLGPDLETDFTGYVDMSGRGLGINSFFMQIYCDLDSVQIEDYYFDEVSGSFDLDLSRINFHEGFGGRYKNTTVSTAGSLEYEGNIDIRGNAFFRDLTDYTGQIFLKNLGGRGTAVFHVTGLTADFDVDASFHSDSCWTYGLEPGEIYIIADLNSFVSHQVGTVDGYWLGGELYSVKTNSGYFETSVSGDRVFIDTAFVNSAEGGLWMQGDYDGTTVPPVFRVDTLWTDVQGIELRSEEPLLFSLYENETEFTRFKLLFGSGSVEMGGIVTSDLLMDLDFKADGFQIRPALHLLYTEREIEGLLSVSSTIQGTFENPILDASIKIDGIEIDHLPIGNFEVEADYADGYLVTKKGELKTAYGSYEFFGKLPMNLSFEEVENRFPNDPVDMQMTAGGNRLLLSEVFITSIDTFITNYSVNMAFTGSYENPLITGEGELNMGEDGVLKTLELETPLRNLSAKISMENEVITIVDASARVSARQTRVDEYIKEFVSVLDRREEESVVRAKGTMRLLGLANYYYDIDVTGRNFFFKSDQYDISGICDFDLNIDGPTPPVVDGDIVMTRLDIREEFQSFYNPEYEEDVGAIEDSSLWNLDLDIFAQNNIWINNSQINAEFKADMHVERNVGILNILGTLDVIRGNYYLGPQRFRFESGVMTFQDVAKLNPDIDFLVSTRLRGAEGDASITEIDLNITGTLFEPRISAASGSSLSNEDVLRMLLQGNIAAAGGTQTVIEGAGVLARSIGLDPRTTQDIVEEIEFSAGQGGEGQAGFTLAKYISPDLYLRYSQHLSADNPGRTIGVEYYLNNNFILKASQGQQGSEYEGISLDINFSVEF
jgi:hypothetical protein